MGISVWVLSVREETENISSYFMVLDLIDWWLINWTTALLTDH